MKTINRTEMLKTQYECMTRDSQNLFTELAGDAPEWSGTPLLGGNFNFESSKRGNLTDLKIRGLITTQVDPENGCCWVYFTEDGEAMADMLGYPIHGYPIG